MKSSQSIENLAKALVSFHTEVKDPKRDANNPFFKSKYVTLDVLIGTVRPVLAKHGLSFLQIPSSADNGKVGCTTILMHETGEYIESEPFVMSSQKNDPQGYGSALTYARRYSLSATLGVAWDDDDDGNYASQPQQQQKKAPRKVNPKEPTSLEIIRGIAVEVNDIAMAKGIGKEVVIELIKGYNVKKFSELNIDQANAILEEIKAK